MSQPAWVFKRWPEHSNKTTIEIISYLRNMERDGEFNELKKYQITGGLLLGEWIKQLKIAINLNQKKSPLKMSLYSGVSNNLISLYIKIINFFYILKLVTCNQILTRFRETNFAWD